MSLYTEYKRTKAITRIAFSLDLIFYILCLITILQIVEIVL